MAIDWEKRKAYQKQWVKTNKEKQRKSGDLWKTANWEKSMFLAAKANAKAMNRDFSIEIEDIEIPTFCPYLGVKLTRELRRTNRIYNPSIDRIDSSKGYIKGNIQVISNKANRMKSNFTTEELLLIASNILRLHKE